MGKPKFLLKKKKNSGSPAYRKRVYERWLNRQYYNAGLQYHCNSADFKNCRVVLPRLNLTIGKQYQEISLRGNKTIIKKPVVLSLFDGISSGLIALQRLGISPSSYFSSEIEKYCLRIQRFNFGGKVIQLGDVCDMDESVLKGLPPVDLLIGGSPCQDLSRVNPDRQRLDGEEGSGQLFYQFLRVLLFFKYQAYLQKRDKEFFFMYENVFNMDSASKETISRLLGCEPVLLCSTIFTSMRRERYFWTNIPICKEEVARLMAEAKNNPERPCLQDFLLGSGRKAVVDTLPTFTSNLSNMAKGGQLAVHDEQCGPMHPYYSEIEGVFGYPVNYTAGPNTPLHIRKKVLANSWDVHTLEFIFKHLIPSWQC